LRLASDTIASAVTFISFASAAYLVAISSSTATIAYFSLAFALSISIFLIKTSISF
jgi:hypothetical protein